MARTVERLDSVSDKKPDNEDANAEDEATLFRNAMGGADPIKHRARHQHRIKPKARAVMRRRDERAALEESWADIPPDEIADELSEHMVYFRPQVTKRNLRDLRRGKLAVQDYIDLHGMTVREAMTELRQFMAYALQNRLRVVRIVTGKGLRSKTGPKIRPKVLKWLQQCDDVMAYAPAPQHDGGSGAVYVLLR